MIVNIKFRNPEKKKEKVKIFSKQWWKSNIFTILSLFTAVLLVAFFIMCFIVEESPIPDYLHAPCILIVCIGCIFLFLMSPYEFRMTRKEWFQYTLISKAVRDRTIRKVMFSNGGYKIILLIEADNKRLEKIVLDNYGLVQSCDTQYTNLIEIDCNAREVVYYFENNIPCDIWLDCEIIEY